MVKKEPVTNAETQLASFYAKYEPEMAKLGKALRAKLRARLPGLFEIVYVYESQNALVISYSPTEHGYDEGHEPICVHAPQPIVQQGEGFRRPGMRDSSPECYTRLLWWKLEVNLSAVTAKSV